MFSNTPKLAIIVAILYLIIFFALGSGLINSIIEGRQSSTAFIIPSRSVQTIGETILITIILFMGLVGVHLVYRSGKAVTIKSQEGFLATGFAIIGISMVLGFMVVNFKI